MNRELSTRFCLIDSYSMVNLFFCFKLWLMFFYGVKAIKSVVLGVVINREADSRGDRDWQC